MPSFVFASDTAWDPVLEFMDTAVVPIVGLILTAIGVVLAQSLRRQMKLKLAGDRHEAYTKLWEITGLAAPTRNDGWGDDGHLTRDERLRLWYRMTDWYYRCGQGMLLGDVSKTLYLNAKHNLLCRDDDLRPEGLDRVVRSAVGKQCGDVLSKVERGNMSIEQMSLLRTQLKSDLAVFGQTYEASLSDDQLYFLKMSHARMRSKAWRRTLRGSWKWLLPRWLLRKKPCVKPTPTKPLHSQRMLGFQASEVFVPPSSAGALDVASAEDVED
jgi:hypothetical protein